MMMREKLKNLNMEMKRRKKVAASLVKRRNMTVLKEILMMASKHKIVSISKGAA